MPTIEGVRPGSEAFRAGLRNSDILLDYAHPDRGLTEFYEDLHIARGREICIRVVPFFAEGPVEGRPVKRACLQVPR